MSLFVSNRTPRVPMVPGGQRAEWIVRSGGWGKAMLWQHNPMDIGFIGLGSMGARIATFMLDAGHHLTLWARRPVSLEPFAERSDIAISPLEVGKASQLVGICVWDEHDVDEVL